MAASKTFALPRFFSQRAKHSPTSVVECYWHFRSDCHRAEISVAVNTSPRRTGGSRFVAVQDFFHARGASGLVLLALLLAILLPELLGGEHWRELLRFDRGAIAAGEWWRLLGAHFVHLNPAHALVNAAGAFLIWGLVGDAFGARRWLLIIALTITAVSAGLWWRSSDLQWYVGASGFLHGLLAAGVVAQIMHGDRLARLIALIVAAKLVYESIQGHLPITSDASVVVAAHLYGAIGGALSATIICRHPSSE